MDKKTSALIALLLASAGGGGWLAVHHGKPPTLREVYAACEKGQINGIVCCEDVLKMDVTEATSLALSKDHPLNDKQAKLCGAIRPGFTDPLGFRTKEQDDWDKMH